MIATTTEADLERAVALRKMKLIALALLLTAATIYVIARVFEDQGAAWGYIRAFSEAAMVGALADWFAVTALFRHPLGIPIPHTAIIPTRKDALGRSLGEFVETNFMSKDVLGERISGAHVGLRLGTWLADDANAGRASKAIVDVVHGAIEVVDDKEVEEGLARIVEGRIRAIAVAPLLGRAIDVGVQNGYHVRLLDAIFAGLQGFLAENRSTFRERLTHESPWWVPEVIDNRIFDKIYDGVDRFLLDVRAEPDHEVRISIANRTLAFAERLRTDPELLAKGEEIKEEVLAHPDMQAWVTSLWGETKQALLESTSSADSEINRRIAGALQRLGERLHDEPELQAKVDRWVAQAVGYLIDNYKTEVSALIESTIERWDGESTSRKIELQVGRDLQFIRINGTVVGGLAGLLIYTVTELLLK